MGAGRGAKRGSLKARRLSGKADKRANALDKARRKGSAAKVAKKEGQWRGACKRWRKEARKKSFFS